MKLYKHISTFKVQALLIALFFSGIALISTSEIPFSPNDALNVVQAQDLNEDEVGVLDEVTCQCSSTFNPWGNEDCTANNWGATCHSGTEFCSIGSENCCGSDGCEEEPE